VLDRGALEMQRKNICKIKILNRENCCGNPSCLSWVGLDQGFDTAHMGEKYSRIQGFATNRSFLAYPFLEVHMGLPAKPRSWGA